MLEDLQCDVIFLTAGSQPPIVKEILSKRAMQTMMIPELEATLMKGQGPLYPYNKTYAQAKHEPFVVLQTSGKTGLLKTVVLNHGTLTRLDLFLWSRDKKALNLARLGCKRVLLCLPQFHNASISFLAFSVYSKTVPVLSSWPVSTEIVNEAHPHARVDASFLWPSTLVDIVRNPEYLGNLKRLQYVTISASNFPQEIGNKVKDLAHLFVCFETTETSYYALEETDPDDWQYVSFSPIMSCELRSFTKGLHELFFVRNDSLRYSQGIFSTLPSLAEKSTKDLYSKHPTKEGLYLYEGRTDDILIFSDTRTHFPQETERILNAHPAVTSALVCGHGRSQAALLIEARVTPETDEERSARMAEIWPSIELANKKITSSQGQITEDMVMFTAKARPMLRVGNGPVLRHETVELYRPDLDWLFSKHEKASQP